MMLLQVSLPRLEKNNQHNDYISSKLVLSKPKKKQRKTAWKKFIGVHK